MSFKKGSASAKLAGRNALVSRLVNAALRRALGKRGLVKGSASALRAGKKAAKTRKRNSL